MNFEINFPLIFQASLQVVTPSREKLNIAATEDIGDSLYSRKVLGVSTTESNSFYDIKSSVMEKVKSLAVTLY